MPPSPRARLRRLRPLLLATPLVALLFAAEVAGRLLERYAGYMPRRSASYMQGNSYLRVALVPGMRFAAGPYEVDVNRLGFRGPEIPIPKTPGTFRIFALGESTTFGWKGARSHTEAWPALLEAKLRAAHPDRRIEVVNAGVPGYTSVEQRINLMLRISRLEPDAVLLYHGNNDIDWSWVPDVETKLIYGRASVGPPSTLSRLLDHSYVYLEIRSRIDLLGRFSRGKHDDVDDAAMRMLRWNLSGLVGDARRMGLQVAIGTFAHALDEAGAPGRYSEDEKRLGVPLVGRWFANLSAQGARRSFPAYNAMIRELASGEKLPLVEAARGIPPTPEYHTDWCHLTARGETLMAQLWFDALESSGWLGPIPPHGTNTSAAVVPPRSPAD